MRLWEALITAHLLSVVVQPVLVRKKRIAYGDTNVSAAWRSVVVQLQHISSRNGAGVCGGTLISSDLVLTAAHCLTSMKEPRLKIITDDPNCTIDTEEFVTVKTFIHPAFTDKNGLVDTKKRTLRRSRLFFNDIALLQLQSNISCLTDGFFPPTTIDLAPADFITNSTVCHVVGWGSSEAPFRAKKPTLKKAKVQLIHVDSCESAYGLDFKGLPSGLVCATDPTHEGQDACEVQSQYVCYATAAVRRLVFQGDSGSPLICSIGGFDYFAGLVSVGARDCRQKVDKLPGVYTHLGHFESWIKAVQSECAKDKKVEGFCKATAPPRKLLL